MALDLPPEPRPHRPSNAPLYEAFVMYDYDAVEPTELSVKAGQIVSVREENEAGWALVKCDGKAGWVPCSFIERNDYIAEAPSAAVPAAAPSDSADPSSDSVVSALSNLNVALDKPREKCFKCHQDIKDKFVVALDKPFHLEHFTCTTCSKPLAGQPFLEKDNEFYCEDDYYRKFNPPCAACNTVIKGQYITALGQSWHPEHFVCTECNQPFTGNQFRKHEDKPYCDEHYNKLFGLTCSKCNQLIEDTVFEALGKKFHLGCFTCEVGNHAIGDKETFHVYEEKVYCTQHFEEMFLQKCAGCGQLITAEYLRVLDAHYHPQCWKCANCEDVISRSTCEQYMMKFYCKPCFGQIVKANASTVAPAAAAAIAAATAASGASSNSRLPANYKPTTRGPTKPAPSKNGAESKEDKKDDAEDGKYLAYNVLKLRPPELPEWVDITRKEDYLSPDVFEKMFKMTVAEFKACKAWKQRKLKESLGLW